MLRVGGLTGHVPRDPVRPADDRHVLRSSRTSTTSSSALRSSRSSVGCTTGSRRSRAACYFERTRADSLRDHLRRDESPLLPDGIVGLLGMPRRVYTYPGGLGWTSTTQRPQVRSGATSRLVGILVAARGPFRGRTAAARWPAPTPGTARRSSGRSRLRRRSTTSPSSRRSNQEPYPELGRRPVRRRSRLDDGHEHVSTPVDGPSTAEIVDMPNGSPWPIVLALCIARSSQLLASRSTWLLRLPRLRAVVARRLALAGAGRGQRRAPSASIAARSSPTGPIGSRARHGDGRFAAPRRRSSR